MTRTASERLAIATDDPDEEVASALERAAVRAVERGATAAAAELCERALRLRAPAAADRPERRRALPAAKYHWAAADTEQARAVLQETAGGGASGEARAEALCELAWIHLFRGEQPEGLTLARRALAGLRRDTTARAGVRGGLRRDSADVLLEEVDDAGRLWTEAVELARRADDVRGGVRESLRGGFRRVAAGWP